MNNNAEFISRLLNEFLACKKIKKEIIVERPNNKQFGHFSTNLALLLKKDLKKAPLDIADEIIEFINDKKLKILKKIDCVKPGFINFTFESYFLTKVIPEVLKLKDNYGRQKKKNFKYNLEIVSANPTGELHVGHARNGVIGDVVARVMRFGGYDVVCEYYTNDAGVQINTLVTTVFIHYLNILGVKTKILEECYKGDIYKGLAQTIVDKYKDKFKHVKINNFVLDNKNAHELFKEISLKYFLDKIKNYLKILRINIDFYISEQAAYDLKLIDKLLAKYEKLKLSYIKDGALWLKTEQFGDQKDRVLRKRDGTYTYLTPDIASHCEKFERTKANTIIDFWGGDHHGYIERLKIGVKIAGYGGNDPNDDLIEVQTIQMVRVIKDGQELKMSKRKGTALWIKDVVDLVGVNFVRFMLSSKSQDTHMDFDINLLNNKNSKNPLFYIKHAIFRSKSILKQSTENKDFLKSVSEYKLLTNELEKELMIELDLFQEYILSTIKHRKPNILCDYLQQLAKLFHAYYNDFKILDDDNIELSKQRLSLVKSINYVLNNTINLIGIEFED